MKELRRPALVDEGFTLTELAVVMVIVALLVGGLLVPLSSQVDIRNLNDTRKSLAEVREALLGFAAANGRLPCPAAATTASAVPGAGQAPVPVGGVCPNDSGVLPWATLGVNETDAWGRRYTYRVTPVFARSVPPPPQNAAFLLSSRGDLDVSSCTPTSPPTSPPTCTPVIIASEVPAVIISHGKNGNGAYTSQGTQLPTGLDNEEQDNQLTGTGVSMANKGFFSKTPTPTFDDEVVWISPGVLFSRMIAAGKLP